ncbi:DUF3072 domain-containing protein [Desertihabitans brevis]|uniref:DUF3072 domain-containing protein n=1 Tax=Desertihabitans brevis TaxID=2268447 RepID=A0A367YWX1_9ACTN|nr:DUF3072 domain-containing protein [Desertihabitans brevis]RCK70320.1 DUF3072 domain-containing protein [Desertihabitans brevis]
MSEQPQDEQSTSAGETIGASSPGQDESLERDPQDWVSGDDPMTEAQRSYLDTLAKRAGEELPADLTKAQASEHIERLREGGQA